MKMSHLAATPILRGRMMIDWLTCRIPVRLPKPIAGGWTVKINQDGTERSRTPHRVSVEGSFSSALTIRAPSTTELEVSGNLLKWLQGHNLYGTDDLRSLLWAALQRLEPNLGGSLAAIGLTSARSLDDTIITRVDCTYMLQLDSLPDVLSWIRSAYATGFARRRGRGIMREGTLVFGDAQGRNFTRWQIVIYSKGQEIVAHPLPDMMTTDTEVLDWTNKALRVEARIGRLELQKQSLRTLSNWSTHTCGAIWSDKMGSLAFNDVGNSENVELVRLPEYLRGTYAQWKLGADLRQTMKRAKFYRHRALIRELTGVDIAVPPAPKTTATVVPIKRALEARLAGRPDWADRIDAKLREAGAIIVGSAA